MVVGGMPRRSVIGRLVSEGFGPAVIRFQLCALRLKINHVDTAADQRCQDERGSLYTTSILINPDDFELVIQSLDMFSTFVCPRQSAEENCTHPAENPTLV